LREGGTLPVVLNAANEVAVEAFLEGRLSFPSIPRLIERTMNVHEVQSVSTLEVVRAVDTWARDQARDLARELELTF
jgi:1-deoxy-D-xylulose-5-phosphate reductoisomerase